MKADAVDLPPEWGVFVREKRAWTLRDENAALAAGVDGERVVVHSWQGQT